MEKFSNIKKYVEDVVSSCYSSETLNIIKHNDLEYIDIKDKMFILPYIYMENSVYLNVQDIPAFKLRYKNNINFKNVDKFVTCISDNISENETLQNCVRRLLYDNCNIILNSLYDIVIGTPLFIDKTSVSLNYYCIIKLNTTDYQVIHKEKTKNNIIALYVDDISAFNSLDVNTAFLLNKMKMSLL